MISRSRRDHRRVLGGVAGLLLVSGCTSGGDAATTTPASAPTTVPEAAASTTTRPEATAVTTEPDIPTTSPTTSGDAPADTIPAADCRRITDFTDDDPVDSGWFIVNDGVMGGRSNGSVQIVDSAMRFSGTVVTDGGGFTSVRYRLVGPEMAGTSRMSMRVRADQRVYGVTFEDDAEVGQRSVSHRADLDTTGAPDDEGWTIASLDYSSLEPTVFGRAVDAPPFDPDAAREIGIIIADSTDGEFSLDIAWIDVCD